MCALPSRKQACQLLLLQQQQLMLQHKADTGTSTRAVQLAARADSLQHGDMRSAPCASDLLPPSSCMCVLSCAAAGDAAMLADRLATSELCGCGQARGIQGPQNNQRGGVAAATAPCRCHVPVVWAVGESVCVLLDTVCGPRQFSAGSC